MAVSELVALPDDCPTGLVLWDPQTGDLYRLAQPLSLHQDPYRLHQEHVLVRLTLSEKEKQRWL